MFVDEIRVFARAGHGGKGCIAFQREKYRPKGGPSGGNGGRGGDVILQADHDLNNLVAQYFNPRLLAEDGEAGMGKGMDGHAGQDLIVKVPCGTLVWQLNPPPDQLEEMRNAPAQRASLPAGSARRGILRYAGGERALEAACTDDNDLAPPVPSLARSDAPSQLVADLIQHGHQHVLAHGGRGGLGNRNFATSVRQTPRFAQPGEPGDEGVFRLELRMIADVGLVGYPNAGKSTLLTSLSKARPKVAPYPFTTLRPQVGMVEYPDFHRLILCDVPGLIEGAHRNVGLGHAFLRHIQRCKILVLLLDMAGTDGRLPWNDHAQLLSELNLYDPALLSKPRLVVANKMDEPAAEANLRKFKRRVPRTPVLPIAAAFDVGTDHFKKEIRQAVERCEQG
jgi:GTPase